MKVELPAKYGDICHRVKEAYHDCTTFASFRRFDHWNPLVISRTPKLHLNGEDNPKKIHDK